MITHHILRLIFFLLLAWSGCLSAQEPIGGDRDTRQSNPVLSADGTTLYFCRPDHPRNQGNDHSADLWVVRRKADGGWGKAINPGSPINSFAGDRPLHLSLDGSRIAVLRSGSVPVIDLLERANRNWRLLQRWSLPADADTEQVAFNANSLEVVYSASKGGKLYHREALPSGRWGQAMEMSTLGEVSEAARPRFLPDGRTLMYRSTDNRWMYQPDRGLPARPTGISPRYLQLSIAGEQAIAMTDDLGTDERLLSVPVAAEDKPLVYTLTQSTSGISPDEDHLAGRVYLNSGLELSILPDATKQYTVALRKDEVIFSDSEGPLLHTGKRAGSLAGGGVAVNDSRKDKLQKRLTRQEEALAGLDEVSSRDYTEPTGDTLPPSATDATRARYAKDLEELARMKQKFRQQQERKLYREDRGGTLTPPLQPPPTVIMLDSTDLRSGVRSGLYPDQRPMPSERRGWENNISNDLPATTAKNGEVSSEVDEAYEQKLREVEALRAQLQQARGGSVVKDPREDPLIAPTVGPSASSASANLSVTFIPNTAYPNADGYSGLEGLVAYVKKASSLVEIRVHTGRELDARAAQLLSEERATTIRDYLTGQGIAAPNFKVVGFGNHESAAGERVELITFQ